MWAFSDPHDTEIWLEGLRCDSSSYIWKRAGEWEWESKWYQQRCTVGDIQLLPKALRGGYFWAVCDSGSVPLTADRRAKSKQASDKQHNDYLCVCRTDMTSNEEDKDPDIELFVKVRKMKTSDCVFFASERYSSVSGLFWKRSVGRCTVGLTASVSGRLVGGARGWDGRSARRRVVKALKVTVEWVLSPEYCNSAVSGEKFCSCLMFVWQIWKVITVTSAALEMNFNHVASYEKSCIVTQNAEEILLKGQVTRKLILTLGLFQMCINVFFWKTT